MTANDQRPVAIVTGAASGIGRATVQALSAAGTSVVAVDLHEPEVGDVRLAGDVTDEKVNRAMIEAAVEEFGRLDTAAFVAGVAGRSRFDEVDLSVLDRMIAVNLRAVALGIQSVTPVLRAGGGGSIVAVSSVMALGAGPGVWPYSASKAAVLSLVQGSALDLAAAGIRVNAVCPGAVHSGMTNHIRDGRPSDYDRLRTNIPLGRWGEPEEVAAVIAFLASPAASYVSGVALPVDGALTAASPLYAPYA